MSSFYKGASLRIKGNFKDYDEKLEVDPSTVTLLLRSPSSNSEFVYGIDDDLVRDSQGKYHVDFTADESGRWHWRWESTGTGKGTVEGSFRVLTTFFPGL